jgi:hypothetical protein
MATETKTIMATEETEQMEAMKEEKQRKKSRERHTDLYVFSCFASFYFKLFKESCNLKGTKHCKSPIMKL